MKRFIFPLAALLIVFLGSSFISPAMATEDIRQLDSFDGIGISISADVYYIQGDKHEISIEGDDRDVEELITEVRDGFLKVKYNDWRIKRSKLTIYITSKELESVKMSGSGQFNMDKPLSSEEMELAISGSGDISFTQLKAEEVDVKISGSGDIYLESGSAEELDVKISGSGKLMAETFKVSECGVSISGSGGVKITCTDELESRISGSGKVHYHGDPRVNSTSSGSGKTASF